MACAGRVGKVTSTPKGKQKCGWYPWGRPRPEMQAEVRKALGFVSPRRRVG